MVTPKEVARWMLTQLDGGDELLQIDAAAEIRVRKLTFGDPLGTKNAAPQRVPLADYVDFRVFFSLTGVQQTTDCGTASWARPGHVFASRIRATGEGFSAHLRSTKARNIQIGT